MGSQRPNHRGPSDSGRVIDDLQARRPRPLYMTVRTQFRVCVLASCEMHACGFLVAAQMRSVRPPGCRAWNLRWN